MRSYSPAIFFNFSFNSAYSETKIKSMCVAFGQFVALAASA